MDGIAGVQARIAEIQSLFEQTPSPSSTSSTGSGQSTDFSSALAQAQSSLNPSDSSSTGTDATSITATSGTTATTPAGPATTNREQWAHDFLSRLGLPVTSENVRAMVAWQQAEGTRAQFNPLATTQNMPGATQFNSVGVKNYVTYGDGLTANIKAITNGRYPNILAALKAGNNADAVAQAIANSPWGTGGLVERILQGTA
jgi:hypothetical protein